jgi:hypothetical protein
MIDEKNLESLVKTQFRRLPGVEILGVTQNGVGFTIDFAIGEPVFGRDVSRCIFAHRIYTDELQRLAHDEGATVERIGEPMRRLQQLVEDARTQGRAEGKQEAKEDLRGAVRGAIDHFAKAMANG